EEAPPDAQSGPPLPAVAQDGPRRDDRAEDEDAPVEEGGIHCRPRPAAGPEPPQRHLRAAGVEARVPREVAAAEGRGCGGRGGPAWPLRRSWRGGQVRRV